MYAPTTVRIPGEEATLVADTFGDHHDPPVVLLHGGGQTRHSWRATGSTLAQAGWYAIAVDLRGHGNSDWSATGNYGLSSFTADVHRIAEHMSTPPVLIGASIGGIASLAAVGQKPTMALGLVMVDVSPFVQTNAARLIRQFMSANIDGFASMTEVIDAVKEYLPHRSWESDRCYLRRHLRRRGGRLYWHWDPELIDAPLAPGDGEDPLIDPPRLRQAAASLRLPTMLIRGSQSQVLSITDASNFLNLVPHAEFVSIDGAHHMVAGDDNDAFGEVVASFLERRIRPQIRLRAQERSIT